MAFGDTAYSLVLFGQTKFEEMVTSWWLIWSVDILSFKLEKKKDIMLAICAVRWDIGEIRKLRQIQKLTFSITSLWPLYYVVIIKINRRKHAQSHPVFKQQISFENLGLPDDQKNMTGLEALLESLLDLHGKLILQINLSPPDSNNNHNIGVFRHVMFGVPQKAPRPPKAREILISSFVFQPPLEATPLQDGMGHHFMIEDKISAILFEAKE